MVTLPAADYISDDARTQGELKQALEDMRQFLEDRFGLDSGILARSKNAFINGDFDLWQRGFSLTTTADGAITYLPDRWNHLLSGAGGAITISRQAFTLGQTEVPGEPTYFYRAEQTAAPASFSRPIQQRVESVRTFAGQTVTVSFYAKADVAQTFQAVMQQNFGSGGSQSGSVSYYQDIVLGTTWAPYALTYDLAPISGKTLGSNGNDFLAFHIRADPANPTFTLDMAQMQLEPGAGATPFDKRQPGEEYTLAARYYAKSYRLGVPPGTTPDLNGVAQYVVQNNGVNWNAVSIFLPVKMRKIPTLTYYNPHAANAKWRNVNKASDSGGGTNFGSGEDRFGISNPQVAGDALGDSLGIHWTADAEL